MNNDSLIDKKERYSEYLILSLSAAICILGWDIFNFITDDAFIAFRYIANSQEGFGYVWNRPPFLPVEGYTSFLWVFILDLLWTVTGFTPPVTSNIVSLIFSIASIQLTIRLIRHYYHQKPGSISLPVYQISGALLLISNRTFLTWTSSGLETAMFNFFLLLWFYGGVKLNRENPSTIWLFSSAATLSALTRPDGMLFAAATCVIIAIPKLTNKNYKNLLKNFTPLTPLTLIPLHLIWRFSFYGEWLPNTYYAKAGTIWPEAGFKYLISFILEYALVFWLVVVLIGAFRKFYSKSSVKTTPPTRSVENFMIYTLILHIFYYIVFIGGDHFEYRILSHTIPLISISFVNFISQFKLRKKTAILIISIYMIFSIQIPYTHWFHTKKIDTRSKSYKMFVPVTPHLPFIMKPSGLLFDKTQKWLIEHFICIRHQEHKVFANYIARRLPEEIKLPTSISKTENPVLAAISVGVVGWKYPNINIIDLLGLNDYVAARTKPISSEANRHMAHNRLAPEPYVQAFMPNAVITGNGEIVPLKRRTTLTNEKIKGIEKKYRSQLKR